jgi:hypothetical protein
MIEKQKGEAIQSVVGLTKLELEKSREKKKERKRISLKGRGLSPEII